MPDVLDLMDTLSKLNTTELTIHPERCVVVRNCNASCRRCSVACTSGAIVLEGNELVVNPDACVGCGTCATVCPTMALEARNPTDSELLQLSVRILREHSALPVYACKPLLEEHKDEYDKARVIEVGCLGRLEESELVTLIVSGISPLLLAHGDCASCDRAAGHEVNETVYATMATLLSAWGQSNPIVLVSGLPKEVVLMKSESARTEDVDGMSRRDFFTQIRTGITTAASQAAVHTLHLEQTAPDSPKRSVVKVMADGTLPHFVPSRRERMLDHLDLMGEPQAERLNTRLWGYLSINDELCSSCKMCAIFCPTGAITKYDELGDAPETGVEHYPADCVQCRLCEDICPKEAINISSDVPLSDLVRGEIIRFPMKAVKQKPNDPKQIYNAMYELLGGGQIYER